MARALKSSTKAFLTVLMMTLAVWILRGIGILTFIPGWVLWALILLCVATAVVSAVR
ncbi:hypothetical protein J5X98_01285 [Leptothermofonsia sichuanensis E412]|jgi:hypothetical protein|uniref:hypothetical protein n=1 Tax=Leptothermofonsia sichuanensis TaxID=2917832 RepID=UPI001CA623FF|nr:hypothetical protein [Leptothermofonsia sichuanensis]QZZ21169.1 hypothetical protein J5X98_01285 [Leptothermofonsia sichuanensis E412]